MIRNVPNKYTKVALLQLIDRHHAGTYDFFYLPIDARNKCNLGYAFLNMKDPLSIVGLAEEFSGKRWERFKSDKVCEVTYARIQGKESLIDHFRTSRLMNKHQKYRPVVADSRGHLCDFVDFFADARQEPSHWQEFQGHKGMQQQASFPSGLQPLAHSLSASSVSSCSSASSCSSVTSSPTHLGSRAFAAKSQQHYTAGLPGPLSSLYAGELPSAERMPSLAPTNLQQRIHDSMWEEEQRHEAPAHSMQDAAAAEIACQVASLGMQDVPEEEGGGGDDDDCELAASGYRHARWQHQRHSLHAINVGAPMGRGVDAMVPWQSRGKIEEELKRPMRDPSTMDISFTVPAGAPPPFDAEAMLPTQHAVGAGFSGGRRSPPHPAGPYENESGDDAQPFVLHRGGSGGMHPRRPDLSSFAILEQPGQPPGFASACSQQQHLQQMQRAVPRNGVVGAGLRSGPGGGGGGPSGWGGGPAGGKPDSSEFVINYSAIMQGFDGRTAVMLKNVPNKYSKAALLQLLDQTHGGTYDFFYLPIDFRNKCNLGYAFINFRDPRSIVALAEAFSGKRWERFKSDKVCEVTYARIQGKESLIDHFRSSRLVHKHEKYCPLALH